VVEGVISTVITFWCHSSFANFLHIYYN